MNIVHLFDKTFFKFLIGFTFILTLSFAVLFVVGGTTKKPASNEVTAQVTSQ